MTLGVSQPLRMHSSCSSCRRPANSSAISFWYVSRDLTRTPHCSLYSSIRSRQSKMSRSARSSGGTMRLPQNGGDTLGGVPTLRGATSVTAASCWPEARSAPAILLLFLGARPRSDLYLAVELAEVHIARPEAVVKFLFAHRPSRERRPA